MKTKRIHTNGMAIRGAVFAALALAFAALLPGCSSDDSGKGASPGTAELRFNVAGINDAADSTSSRALPAPETVNQVQADGTVLSFTLTPDARPATRATSAMTVGNTYKYVVLNSGGKIVGAVDGVAGTQTAAVAVDNTQAYTIAAYSYNNTASMPSPGSAGASPSDISVPANTDLLYFSESLGANTLSAGLNARAVTFSHKYSSVKVVVDASSFAANVTAASGFTLGASYPTTMPVLTGTPAKSGTTSTPAAVTFSALGSPTVTSDAAVLFTNGETPLTLSVGTLTIGGTTYSNKTVSFARALASGVAYTLTVSAHAAIPAGVVLAQNQMYFVPSVKDADYLTTASPTVAAATGPATTVTPSAADGTAEPGAAIDIQGIITTTGVTVKIPVTAGSTTNLPAYSATTTVPASLQEGGSGPVTLTLSWAGGQSVSAGGYVTATIKAVSTTLNAKKLDFNTGIGNDLKGVLMAAFSYPYDHAGDLTTYSVRDIAAIPDKKYGQTDLGDGTFPEHQFLYLPVRGEDGLVWLSNNLGAGYAQVGNDGTNIKFTSQATSSTDYSAYGSLFQWGRQPDGHELITWTSGTAGAPKYSGTTGTLSDSPTNTLFITNNASTYDWRVNQNDNLWNAGSANNPCPSGFSVPTKANQDNLIAASGGIFGIRDAATAASSNLKFTIPGYRYYSDGFFSWVGNTGIYWSITPATVNGVNKMYSLVIGVWAGMTERAYGTSVRCIKN